MFKVSHALAHVDPTSVGIKKGRLDANQGTDVPPQWAGELGIVPVELDYSLQ